MDRRKEHHTNHMSRLVNQYQLTPDISGALWFSSSFRSLTAYIHIFAAWATVPSAGVCRVWPPGLLHEVIEKTLLSCISHTIVGFVSW